jgi:hypothetical protein
MQLLSSGYKRLKVLIHIFHSLYWFKILWHVHNVFTIAFFLNYLFIKINYNPKFQKLSSGYAYFWYMLVWLQPMKFLFYFLIFVGVLFSHLHWSILLLLSTFLHYVLICFIKIWNFSCIDFGKVDVFFLSWKEFVHSTRTCVDIYIYIYI